VKESLLNKMGYQRRALRFFWAFPLPPLRCAREATLLETAIHSFWMQYLISKASQERFASSVFFCLLR
jgi:hypothetical protein